MIIRAASRSFIQLRRCYSTPSGSRILSRAQLSSATLLPRKHGLPSIPMQVRRYASVSEADEKIEEIQELYANARDEFEIAAEETEKKTVYAADDREAAQEELKKLKDAYNEAVETSSPDVSAEIKLRVGQRIRELDHAVQGMEEAAKEE